MAKAIVFDMDGVLFDTERIARDSWIETGKVWNLPRVTEIYPRMIGVNHTDGLIIFKECYGEAVDAEEFMRQSGAVMKQILREKGLPIKKGVPEILAFLKEKKIPAAICSSTRTGVIHDHLVKTGFLEYFDQIIGGDMIEHSKPLPDIYLKACEILGQKPEDCIAVEDSPNGIRSAYAAGLIPVMIPDLVEPTEELRKLSRFVLKDMTELQKLIESETI